ncbi:hypothetical protein DU000_05345 [Parvibium lacunae]|uniref:Glycine-zipper-containing OmpA-like membrane domain-containing protein n=2 Tax=Parvibium lacunae TaxID=1888893 RepID=A0A368L554_9BURK|nr:hypothetical protein DU000_05345 [Parvibium lacunae]
MLAACAVTPTGPNVNVMPGQQKTFEQFRADNQECRLFAQTETQQGPTETGFRAGAATAAVGTAVGALAGAAIGGNSQAAAVGAGAGLLLGSAVGGESGSQSSQTMQRRYDNAFIQCMYAKGHQVPVAGRLVTQQPASGNSNPPVATPAAPTPSPAALPPPPSGSPPPPPPGAVAPK